MSTLFVIATPIGNLDDISLRALNTLRTVDMIAAEDTRHSRRLLDHFGINASMISLHNHNEEQRLGYLLEQLGNQKKIALISDAGTPLISDPGYRLVHAVRAAGFNVVPIPGACALVTALSAAGLPSAQFVFEGFLSPKTSARQKQLHALKNETRTIIFYEAPHRILDLVEDMLTVLGPERFIVLARELTKTFETIHGAPLKEQLDWLRNDLNQQKGEFVVLVAGAEKIQSNEPLTAAQNVLEILLTELPTSQAIQLATKITGEKKNKLYEMALTLKDKKID